METAKLREECKRTKDIIRHVGKKYLQEMFSDVTATEKNLKNSTEKVTKADRVVSKQLLKEVRKYRPGSYSEEHMDTDRRKYKRLWQFDPLDGTKEFIHGKKHGFSINAALLERTEDEYESIAGIIYLPMKDTMWYSHSRTIFRNETKYTPTALNASSSVVKGGLRALDPDQNVREFCQRLAKNLDVECNLVEGGGSGAMFIDLLKNNINLYMQGHNLSKEWDIAMAKPFLNALDGFLCDYRGKKFLFNKQLQDGYNVPYNFFGVVASICFDKQTVLNHLDLSQLDDQLAYIRESFT